MGTVAAAGAAEFVVAEAFSLAPFLLAAAEFVPPPDEEPLLSFRLDADAAAAAGSSPLFPFVRATSFCGPAWPLGRPGAAAAPFDPAVDAAAEPCPLTLSSPGDAAWCSSWWGAATGPATVRNRE